MKTIRKHLIKHIGWKTKEVYKYYTCIKFPEDG